MSQLVLIGTCRSAYYSRCIQRFAFSSGCDNLRKMNGNSIQSFENVLKLSFINGVNGVKPAAIFVKCFKEISPNVIKVNSNNNSTTEELLLDISNKQCHLVGFGKAVLGMAVEIERVLGKRLVSGILSVPFGTMNKFKNDLNMHLCKNSVIHLYEGAKDNLPDINAQQTARLILDKATKMQSNDILFICISGGGSALLPLPKESIKLSEKSALIKNLASKGATIKEINTVRIACSNIKGGKLALAAKGAHRVITFIISDIIDDPLDLISSGPTVLSKPHYQTPLEILRKFNLLDTIPASIKNACTTSSEAINNVDQPNVSHFLVGNNKIAINAVIENLTSNELSSVILSNKIEGNVKDLAESYVQLAKITIERINKTLSFKEFSNEISFLKDKLKIKKNFLENLESILSDESNKRPICIVSGGEPTVNITGNGLGGRNQELVLRVCNNLNNFPNLKSIWFLAAGTDGIDGPTDAAGAICNPHIINENYIKSANNNNIELDKIAENNDSYNFFAKFMNGRYHILTGHTGTNVMDIQIMLIPR